MNPFTSTPEATAFWREQQQACEEARRLLVKHPIFAQFLASGGTLAVVSDGFPADQHFAALLKDGDSIYASVMFTALEGEVYVLHDATESVRTVTAWLTDPPGFPHPNKTTMKTAAERIAEFRQELEALLTKHRAELSIIDVGRAYSPDLRIFAMMNSVFKHGECVAEYAEEDLGTYLAGRE